MADGQDYIAMADMDEAMDKIFELDVVPQETRFGATTQHITGDKTFTSQDITVELLKSAYHGATMSASLEGDAPDSYELTLQQMTIARSHLRELAFTISHTLVAETLGRDKEHSAYDPAKRLVLQAMSSIGERRNQALNQGANCVKALVAAKYKADGDTYSQAVSAFLKIDTGSISMFHPGEIVDIRAASDGADIRNTCVVNDVCHTTNFLGFAVGPGIVVTLDTVYGRTKASGTGNGTTTQDEYLDNIADGDEIVRHSEVDGAGFPASFDSLIDLSSSPSAYFGLTRTTAGNFYLVPYGKSYLESSANVNLNLETHFGDMVDTMAMVIGPSRIWRGQNDFKLSNALVAQAQPDLVNEIAKQAGSDNARFTREMSSTMDAARKQTFVANAGWNGAVLHHPGFPPIIVQPEPLCPPNIIRMFEPSAWTFYRLGGKAPNWIRNDGGGRWHTRRNVTTGNLTKIRDASGYVHETVVCDQPRTVYEIEGVKSTLKTA